MLAQTAVASKLGSKLLHFGDLSKRRGSNKKYSTYDWQRVKKNADF